MLNFEIHLRLLIRSCKNIFQRKASRVPSSDIFLDDHLLENMPQEEGAHSKPVMILSYTSYGELSNRHMRLCEKLQRKFTLDEVQFIAQQEAAILRYIEKDTPLAIIIPDPDIIVKYQIPKLRDLLKAVVNYTRRGGITIFAVDGFDTVLDSEKHTSFFSDVWNLPWKAGYWERMAHFSYNIHTSVSLGMDPLPQRIESVQCLKSVAKEHLLYYISPLFPIINRALSKMAIKATYEGPVALARLGAGAVAWVGDPFVYN